MLFVLKMFFKKHKQNWRLWDHKLLYRRLRSARRFSETGCLQVAGGKSNLKMLNSVKLTFFQIPCIEINIIRRQYYHHQCHTMQSLLVNSFLPKYLSRLLLVIVIPKSINVTGLVTQNNCFSSRNLHFSQALSI